jgi:two-component system response regulator TctD
MRVLLVEDTEDVGEAIVARLRKIGYAVDWETNGAAADDILGYEAYDLVILDLMLPEIDGLSILKRLRQRGSSTPVLVLTARSAIGDRVDGLDLGADDYLVKPFDYRELEARARVLLRRGGSGSPTNTLACGDMVLDRCARSVLVRGAAVELTRREFALVEVLTRHPGRVFGKDEIMAQLFSFDDEPPTENAVEQVVARVRRKLATSGSKAEIRTLRGLGYQIVCP